MNTKIQKVESKPLKTILKSYYLMEEEKTNKFIDFYFKNYKKFLVIPLLLLIIALSLLFVKFQTTGDFIDRDISLKGGISLTVLTDANIDIMELESLLKEELSPNEASIRVLKSAGKQMGILMESDIKSEDFTQEKLDSILATTSQKLGKEITNNDYSLESMGSSLGKSFFTQTMQALIIAFLFMGLIVFLYFRTFVPSMAVILSALSDILVTVAVINIIGFKMGTAGIAALLMLIGYSIDTDIMLTTKVLKRKIPLTKAISNAFKTGMTMTLTTIAAVIIALTFTQSEIIRQIMTILLIGLSIDIINTWIQNAGLLLWYVEKKEK